MTQIGDVKKTTTVMDVVDKLVDALNDRDERLFDLTKPVIIVDHPCPVCSDLSSKTFLMTSSAVVKGESYNYKFCPICSKPL